MPQIKIKSTPAHKRGIKQAIKAHETRANLANFLNVKAVMISQWLHGDSVIPLRHAEALANHNKTPVPFLNLRPDFNKYKKYFIN